MSGEDGECTFRWSPLRVPEALSPRPRPMGPDLGLDQLRTPVPPLSLRFQASKACRSRARGHDWRVSFFEINSQSPALQFPFGDSQTGNVTMLLCSPQAPAQPAAAPAEKRAGQRPWFEGTTLNWPLGLLPRGMQTFSAAFRGDGLSGVVRVWR